MRKRVQMFVGDQADRIIEPYRRARPNDSLRDLVLAIATDHAMRMPSLVTADRKVAQQAAPVFVYMFTWETPVLDGKLKSPHALEIPFVFDTVQTSGLTGDSPTRFALADKMSRSWLAFARTGNPNHQGRSELAAVFDRTASDDDVRQSVPGRKRSVSSRAAGLGRTLEMSKVIAETERVFLCHSPDAIYRKRHSHGRVFQKTVIQTCISPQKSWRL